MKRGIFNVQEILLLIYLQKKRENYREMELEREKVQVSDLEE
jgi:hypothetical protein